MSAKRSGSVPLGPAHICLNLGLEAVGSEVLVSDFTRTTHDTHLCCSFRAELVELRCALCWRRHKGERDRGPLLGLNPSCSPLLVRTQCRTVYTRTSVPTEKEGFLHPKISFFQSSMGTTLLGWRGTRGQGDKEIKGQSPCYPQSSNWPGRLLSLRH